MLSPKDPAEIITITFDFTRLIGMIASASVTAISLQGTNDASPQTIMQGVHSISGALVMQRVRAGLAGTTYALRCEASSTDGDLYVLAAALPVAVASAL